MSGNIRVSPGRGKMDSAVKNTQKKKLWLGGLLWWSLLLELASGGNNFNTLIQWKLTTRKLIRWCVQCQYVNPVIISILVNFSEFPPGVWRKYFHPEGNLRRLLFFLFTGCVSFTCRLQ